LTNNNKLLEYPSLFIATITAFAYFCTYYSEAGILKFYNISTRLLSLEIHVFAMSWRAIAILSGASIIWLYLHKCKKGISIKTIKDNYSIVILFSFALLFHTYTYIEFAISDIEISEWFFIISFFMMNSLIIYLLKYIESDFYRQIVFYLIILIIFAEGIGCSYIRGYNFSRNKESYYFINSSDENIVISEQNNYIICSKILNDMYIDSTFSIRYFSSDTMITLDLKKTNKLKPIKNK
jgi:hypothetical protein